MHPEWPNLVEKIWQNHCSLNAQAEAPQRLHMLKRSMRQASNQLRQNGSNQVAHSHEEQLNATMSLLLAAERNDIHAIKRAVAWYPHLSRWAFPIQLESIRDHAIQFTRSDIFDLVSELRDMQQESPSLAS